MHFLPDGGLERALAVVTTEAACRIVAVIEQQAHHHLVLQAVLHGRREHGVTERREVAVDIGTIRKEKSRQLVAAGSNGHQQAAQWVLVRLGAGPEERLGAGDVAVADGKVQSTAAHVAIVLRDEVFQGRVDIKTAIDQQVQAVGVAPIGS